MNKEKKFWENRGENIYFQNNKPTARHIDPLLSEYEFTLLNEYDWSNKEILEIGPGSGRDIIKFNNMGAKLNAIDISEKFTKRLQEQFEGKFFAGDVRNVDKYFNKGSIDLIYSRWSLIHIQKKELKPLLIKFANLLTNEGMILISIRYGEVGDVIHQGNKMQSLQLSEEIIKKHLPVNLSIDFIKINNYASMENKNDKQITIIIKKKNPI